MSQPKIEFFTEVEPLLRYPPVRAAKAMPDWFRRMEPAIELPPSASEWPFGVSKDLRLSNVNATIKRCPGVLSFLAEGYIVPLWTDYIVQVRGETIYAHGANPKLARVGTHSKKHQYADMPLPEGYVTDAVKFINPWKVRTPPGWSVLVSAPFYQFDDRFLVVPGVIDADVYHHMHVNTLFRRVNADHKLPMGMPFIHLLPFQRGALEHEVRLATEADRKRLEQLDFEGQRFFGKNQAIRAGGNDDPE